MASVSRCEIDERLTHVNYSKGVNRFGPKFSVPIFWAYLDQFFLLILNLPTKNANDLIWPWKSHFYVLEFFRRERKKIVFLIVFPSRFSFSFRLKIFFSLLDSSSLKRFKLFEKKERKSRNSNKNHRIGWIWRIYKVTIKFSHFSLSL